MKHVECAGSIVVGPDQKVLVIANQIGKLVLPKGTREEGEEPIDTARREIYEESGLSCTQVKLVRYLGVLVRPGLTATNAVTPSVEKHINMFYGLTEQRTLRPIAPDALEAMWVAPDELRDFLSWPEEADFFAAHRPGLGI